METLCKLVSSPAVMARGAELGRLGGGTSRWRRADVTGVGRPSASSTGRGARPVVSVAGRRPLARLFALRPDEASVAGLPQSCCGRRGSCGSSESGNGGEHGGLGSPCLPVSVGPGRAGSASRKRRSAGRPRVSFASLQRPLGGVRGFQCVLGETEAER